MLQFMKKKHLKKIQHFFTIFTKKKIFKFNTDEF